MYRILAFQGLVIHLVVLTAVSSVGKSPTFPSYHNDLTWVREPVPPVSSTPNPFSKTSSSPKKESYVERIIKIRAQRAKKAALDYKLGNHIEDLYWLTRLKRGSRVSMGGTLFRKDTRRTTPPPERRYSSATYKPSTTSPLIYVNSLRQKFKKPSNLISSDHNQLNFISNDLEDLLRVEDEVTSAQASKKIYSYISTTSSTTLTTQRFAGPTTTTMTSVIATSTSAHPSTEPLPPATTRAALSRVLPPTPSYPVTSTPVYREKNDSEFPVYYKPSYYSDPQWYKTRRVSEAKRPRRHEDDFFFLLVPKTPNK